MTSGRRASWSARAAKSGQIIGFGRWLLQSAAQTEQCAHTHAQTDNHTQHRAEQSRAEQNRTEQAIQGT